MSLSPVAKLAIGDAAHVASAVRAGSMDAHLAEIAGADIEHRGGRGVVQRAVRDREARIASGYDLTETGGPEFEAGGPEPSGTSEE